MEPGSGSRNRFKINGIGTLPKCCHDKPGAECDVEIPCSFAEMIIEADEVAAPANRNDWKFTITGDIGDLVKYKTVFGGSHDKPFPTQMGRKEHDHLQKYKLLTSTSSGANLSTSTVASEGKGGKGGKGSIKEQEGNSSKGKGKGGTDSCSVCEEKMGNKIVTTDATESKIPFTAELHVTKGVDETEIAEEIQDVLNGKVKEEIVGCGKAKKPRRVRSLKAGEDANAVISASVTEFKFGNGEYIIFTCHH